MGLEMYLQAEFVLFPRAWSSERDAKGYGISYTDPKTKAIAALLGADEAMSSDGYVEVKIPIGYWRKANAIHAWFIKDEPEDDCKPFEVSINRLQELDSICKKVIKDTSLAEELLPTQGGFFFGPTDLSEPETLEWYISDLKETRKIIKRCVDLINAYKVMGTKYLPTFYYRASW